MRGPLTIVKMLHRHADDLQARVRRDLQLDVLVAGRGHPHGYPPVGDKRARGEVEDVVQHRFEAVGLFRGYVAG